LNIWCPELSFTVILRADAFIGFIMTIQTIRTQKDPALTVRRSLPFFLGKRTLSEFLGMSQMGHEETSSFLPMLDVRQCAAVPHARLC
jgi:hypothetical protein